MTKALGRELLRGAVIATFLVALASFTPTFGEQAARAQSPTPDEAPIDLESEQRKVAEKFKRFEQVIKLLAQFSDEANEDQARLLRQVFAESQSRSMDGKFDELVALLQNKQLALASGNQEQVTKQLEELLAMLLSADREKELKSEQARVKEFIKQLKVMINKQIELEGRTAGGDLKAASPEQDKLSKDAGELARKMKPQDSAAKAGEKPQDARQSEGSTPKDGERKQGDGEQAKPGGSPKSGEKPQNGKSQPGESQQGEQKSSPGQPQQGQSEQGRQQQGRPQQGSQQSGGEQQQSPMQSPQQRVEEAQRRMEEARKKLDEAQREGAMKKQEEAIRELEQAKAELEEILRQLREEEMARLLEVLERRFTEMLRMQEAVYRDTKGLHGVPVASRGKAEEIEAGRLSREEGLILVAADKALGILKEEGSAVAFPRTVEQMRDDIAQIVDLLAAVKVDELTLAVEEDVIAALKEMIEALQKAKKDLKDKKQRQSGQSGGQDEQPLIDRIAELKMIRALQLRVNRRTRLINESVDVAADAESLEMLKKLASTERDVFQITRDIVTGKNK